MPLDIYQDQADSKFASSQWDTVLFCNDASHWLGASIESALRISQTGIVEYITMTS